MKNVNYDPYKGITSSEDKRTVEEIELAQVNYEKRMAKETERMLQQAKSTKSVNDKIIVPCGYNVVYKVYEENPYREIKQSDSGLILLDGTSINKMYRSNDTGEKEYSEQGIACAEIIAVGEECKYVNEGDDVYLRFTKVPLPFGNRGYYVISEQNIICIIKKKE